MSANTYFENVRVYKSTLGNLKHGAAFALTGIGIFINPKDKHNIHLLRHEFGLILQTRKWGSDIFHLKLFLQA